jgi:uncharacterized protein YjbJ (UPF0337 family)
MTSDVFKGQWKQLKGEIQKQWGNLTDSDLDKVNGSRTELEGIIQEKCGLLKEDAQKQLDILSKKCGC